MGGYKNSSVPSYVRWASEVKLKITLDPDSKGSILIPYLEIEYREKQTSLIHDNTVATVSFVMNFYQNMSHFWKSMLIAFIIFQVFIFVLVVVRQVFFFQNNPPLLLTQSRFIKLFIYKFFFNLFDLWSEVMFWILFFSSMYWFIAYKLSTMATVLLPSFDDWSTSYKVFYLIFALVLIFRLLVIVMKIIEQSNLDLFFIDWENPKPDFNFKIPAWRGLFLANEFNELQSDMRFLTPETTLLWFAFFIRGLGWEYIAKADPDIDKGSQTMEPQNYILLFFISSFIMLCIGAV